MVLEVVPGEETAAVGLPIFRRAETAWNPRVVLESLELGFRERIVVAGMGTAVALVDAKGGQQLGKRLGGHACTAIGMKRQLPWSHGMFGHGFAEQTPSEQLALALGK